MPRYDVTLDTPTTGKGTLVEVPLVGGMENGGTAKNVFLSDEQAEFLATNPHLKLKKAADSKSSDIVAQINKSTDFDELEELARGDDRAEVQTAVTKRRLALSESNDAEESEAPAPAPTEGGE